MRNHHSHHPNRANMDQLDVGSTENAEYQWSTDVDHGYRAAPRVLDFLQTG